MKTCVLCGHTPIEARGLCACCYQKSRRLGLLAAFPRRGRHATGPRAAYWQTYYWRTVERRRAVARASYHRRKAA